MKNTPLSLLLLLAALLCQNCNVCEDVIDNPDNDPGIELIEQARVFMCGFDGSEENQSSASQIINLRKEIHNLEKQVTYIPPQSTWPFPPSGDFDVDLFRVFDPTVLAEIRQKKQDLWAAINDRYTTFGINSLPAEFSDFCKTTSEPGHITGRSQLSSMKYNVDSETLGRDVYVGYTNTVFDWVDTWERHKEPIESFLRNINLWERLPIALGTTSPVLESVLTHQKPIWELANGQLYRDLRNAVIPTVEVLVLYTPETSASLGANPTASIQDVMDLQNDIFNSSRVFGRVVLAGAEQIHDPEGRLESRSSTRSIADLIESTLIVDEFQIKARRQAFDADLVSVWVQLNGTGSGGSYAQSVLSPYICTLNRSSTAQSSFFNVVKAAKAANRYQFAHELGHNLGLSHDRDARGVNRPQFPIGQGYLIKSLAPNKRTVMGYADGCQDVAEPFNGNPNWEDCSRIEHYSNPDVNFSGYATGDADTSNAASVLRNSLRFVSGY
ncbi:MAG: M12 family metallo-peptidase, partial [Bacteroidota bacterium]